MERQSTTFILMKIIRDLNFSTNIEVSSHLSNIDFYHVSFFSLSMNLGP